MNTRGISRASLLAIFFSAGTALLSPSTLRASPVLRFSVDAPGGHLVIGQTLAYDCGPGHTPPAGSTVSCGGVFDDDSAPDIYWRDQTASTLVAASDARTSAALSLPVGATVAHARLYWAALRANAAPDRNVTLDRDGGFTAAIEADDSRAVPASGPLPAVTYVVYQSSADVSDLVRTNGSGTYRVSGVDAIGLDGVVSENAFAAWTLVVIYSLPTGEARHLALYDALDPVASGVESSVLVNGFSVPAAGAAQGSLAAWAYEGDPAQTGDTLRVRATALLNGLNPVDNFWNESRSSGGAAVAGTVPALSGQPGATSGFDLDELDIGPLLASGDTSVRVTAATAGVDEFWFGGFVLSIATDGPPPGLDAGAPDSGSDGGDDGAVADGPTGGDGGDGDGGGGGGNDGPFDAGDGGASSMPDGGSGDGADRDGPTGPSDGGGGNGDGGDDGGRDGGGGGESDGPLTGPDDSVVARGSGCVCSLAAPGPSGGVGVSGLLALLVTGLAAVRVIARGSCRGRSGRARRGPPPP
jgi:hypothetical protein